MRLKALRLLNVSDFLEWEVGECREVSVHIGGVPVKCLLDTGSQVSTITESFFRQHLLGKLEDVFPTAQWLKLTAANSLLIPYLGCLELDTEAMGLNIPDWGFLVVKDPVVRDPLRGEKSATQNREFEQPQTKRFQKLVPGLFGMNIIKRCKQLVTAEFDTTLRGELDPDSREAFQRVQTCETVEKASKARVTGRDAVRVPACSVATVYAKGSKTTSEGAYLLLEPAKSPLPGDLVVTPTLVEATRHVFPVQVVNFSQEDVRLNPRTRLGILSQVECVDNDQTEVRFQRFSVDQ